ncbi:phosphotransacetylase [Dasania marina]|uniref:phosphotransacetylase n=1 Tax=Dasania marina TaxID=471499 RepID=UPI0030D9FD8F|tara:strand:+ start:19194 stop:20177 length:984 start_codon:yes stop_codon:yes gene_type:complete
MKLMQQCRAECLAAPKRIVFADALDTRVLHAANELKKQGLADPILLGNPFELRDYANRSGVITPCLAIVDPRHSGYFDEFAAAYQEQEGKKPSLRYEDAQEAMSNPLFYAAMMVQRGQADICIAGNLSTTGDVLRAALKVIGVAEQHRTVSSFFMMSSPDGKDVRLFADAGVVPEPSIEQLADITIDAAQNFEKLTGETARVALLSFSTKGSSDHPAACRVREAFELVRLRAPNLLVDGELQVDAAIVPAVAAIKAPASPLHGNANVLIFPSLDAGNIAYKIAERLCHYQALGPLLEGLKKPMHDLSRGCSVDDIVNIAVLASCLAK